MFCIKSFCDCTCPQHHLLSHNHYFIHNHIVCMYCVILHFHLRPRKLVFPSRLNMLCQKNIYVSGREVDCFNNVSNSHFACLHRPGVEGNVTNLLS